MSTLKTQVRVTMVLGVLSLLAGGLVHLALTDIYHLESDVTLEWTIVRASALLFLAFTGCAIYTLNRVLKQQV